MGVRRIISWPGAKYRQLGEIVSYLGDLPRDVIICEPFLGSGAFMWGLDGGIILAAEACDALRTWWLCVIRDPERFRDICFDVRLEYSLAGEDRMEFNRLRDDFNAEIQLLPRDMYRVSALFWVLIYSSTNNLARFNRGGGYNQTWGRGRVVPDPRDVFDDMVCNRLRLIGDRMGGFIWDDAFNVLDYFLELDGYGVVYLDPPYLLQTEAYSRWSWGFEHFGRLVGYIEEMEFRGIKWMMTEYLRKDGREHPWGGFFESNFRVVPIKRGIDSRPRGTSTPVEEVLILGGAI